MGYQKENTYSTSAENSSTLKKKLASLNNHDFFFFQDKENIRNEVIAFGVEMWNIFIYFVVVVKEMCVLHLYNKRRCVKE
jgi:hypothetical protein